MRRRELGYNTSMEKSQKTEQIDIYDRDGNLLDYSQGRFDKREPGAYAAVAQVLIRHKDGSFLVTRRDLNKRAYPGLWEASSGGAISAGETPQEAIARELNEETGLEATDFELVALRHCDEQQIIFFCFYSELDCDKDAVVLQEGETIDYAWLSREEFIDLLSSDKVLPNQRRRFADFYRRLGLVEPGSKLETILAQ